LIKKESLVPAKKKSESIECKKAGLIAKRINPYPPQFHSILKKTIFEYKLQRGAIAEILQELEPKRAILNPESMLDLHDKIRGEIIDCLATNVISREEVRSFSGRHRAKYSSIKGYVYCRILRTFF
jgi:hypothetical protein